MLASPTLLASFATKAASFYSGKTVSTWLSGVHSWHIINQAPWHSDNALVHLARTAAAKIGTSFQKPKRPPVTLERL